MIKCNGTKDNGEERPLMGSHHYREAPSSVATGNTVTGVHMSNRIVNYEKKGE